MNLDNAVAAHAQWKTKFRMAISNKDALDAAASVAVGVAITGLKRIMA